MVAGFKCEKCGMVSRDKRPRKAMKVFHLHHVSYERVGSECLDDVLILCPACHLAPGIHPWRDAA